MAHEIDFTTGKAGFVSRKEIPWHKLGKVFDRDLTSQEALQEGGLDFEVIKAPNHHLIDGMDPIISENSFFLYRSDANKVLAPHVGKVYESLQNKDVFSIVDDIISQDPSIKIETAGSLRDGSRTFVSLKGGSIKLGRNDEVESYLLIYNSFDGLTAIQAKYTPVRVVCANTLALAKSGGKALSTLKHYSNSEVRLREALKAVNLLHSADGSFQQQAQQMIDRKLSVRDFYSFLSGVFLSEKEREAIVLKGAEGISTRKANVIKEVIEYAESGPGQNIYQGTAWWGYNAVTGYFQNVREYGSDDIKFESLNYNNGAANQYCTAALELATGGMELPEMKLDLILN